MSETIHSETTNNANLVANVDNIRSRNLEVDLDTDVQVLYPSFEIFPYEINLFSLLKDSIRADFNIKWTQRPDYVSLEYFNTTVFWPLILFMNQIDNIENFKNLDKILIPSYSSILELVRSRDNSIINRIDNNPVVSTDIKYYKVYPLDDTEKQNLVSKSNPIFTQNPLDYLPSTIEDLYGDTWPWIPANITSDGELI